MSIVRGNILDADEKYICHQCNCVTQKYGRGLANHIFKKFPYANIYLPRHGRRDKIGTIKVKGNGRDKRYVINMMAQYYPGAPKYFDTSEYREKYFKVCLEKMAQIPNLESVAFPYLIGCGLADGEWENYLKMIKDFERKVDARVVIYKLPQLW